MSCNIHFIMSQVFLAWQSRRQYLDLLWRIFITDWSVWLQLYNILLVPITRYVLISNFEMLFHHIPTRGVAAMENDLGFATTYSIDFCLRGTAVHSREFSINSCFRTWHGNVIWNCWHHQHFSTSIIQYNIELVPLFFRHLCLTCLSQLSRKEHLIHYAIHLWVKINGQYCKQDFGTIR